MGLELEYVLPFNKNKWALIFEPNFYSYKNETHIIETVYNVKEAFSIVEYPIGLRHYFFLNQKSKVFLNAQLVPFTTIFNKSESSLDYKYDNTSANSGVVIMSYETTGLGITYNLGLGFNYNNKFSIETRISSKRKLTHDYYSTYAKSIYLGLLIGYNIF